VAQLGSEPLARLLAVLSMRTDVAAIDSALALSGSADTTELRTGAASLLAAQRATAAIPELVRQLGDAPEAEARALAWALGRFGAGSFRAVSRALSAAGVGAEREAWVLAALAQHGARAQVRARGRSHLAAEAQLAAHALALANTLKETGNPFVGLEQQGALTVFFDVFDHARQALIETASSELNSATVDSTGLVP